MTTALLTLTLIGETCYKCGIPFGLEAEYRTRLLRSHEMFYCPAGHGQCYIGESDVQRLEREKAKAQQDAQWAREARDHEQEMRFATERRLYAQKGATTRLKRRAASGTCPCCKRTFQALSRHMQHQHPGFVEGASLKAEP